MRLLPYFTILFLIALKSQATIVYVDMNGSDQEIAAAREAAKARNEDILIFPSNRMPDSLKKEIDNINKELNSVMDSLSKRTGNHDQLIGRMQELNKKSIQLKSPYAYDNQKLKADFSSLSKGTNISTLILSGHSEGFGFSGVNGSIKVDQLHDDLQSLGLDKGIRAVFAWGCYTGTPRAQQWWMDNFSNLGLVAGFGEKGPSNKTRASSSLLKDLLIKQKQVIEEGDQKKLTALVKGLTDINYVTASLRVNGSVCRSGRCQCASDIKRDCRGELFLLYSKSVEIVKYISGQEPLPDPDSPHNPLRDYYSLFQNFDRSCFQPSDSYDQSVKDIIAALSSETEQSLLALVKMKNVIGNFNRKYAGDIEAARSPIEKLKKNNGCDMLTVDIPNENMAVASPLPYAIDNCLSHYGDKLSESERKAVQRFQAEVFMILDERKCVPALDGWINNPSEMATLGEPEKMEGCDFNVPINMKKSFGTKPN